MTTAASIPAARTHLPAILPVLGVALLVRLAGLGHAPLWMDEASTLGFARLPWAVLFGPLGALETNPPTYYALMKGWIGLAGTSDLALRLPSVVFGVGGVAAVWALARAAFGPRAAFWAALLMAAQAHHLDHSREARVYALLLLVVALAALAARRVAAFESGRLPWGAAAGLAAGSGAGLLLHNTGAIAVASVFLFAGVSALHRPGRRLARVALLVAAGCGGLLLGAPALLRVLHQAQDGANNASWIPIPDGVLTVQIALSVLAAPLAGFRDAGPGVVGAFFLGAAGVVGLGAGWAAWASRRSADAAGLLLAAVAAVAGMHAISQAVPVLLERTLVFVLVFFVPLLGAALAGLPRPARFVAVGAILALQAPGLVLLFAPARHGEDWRALAGTVQQERRATGWPLVMLGGFEVVALERYLAPGDAVAVSITPDLGAALTTAVTQALTAATALPQHAGPAALCAALPPAGGVLLVQRYSALLPVMQPVAEALLTSAGGIGPGGPGAAPGTRLMLQRWPGACAVR